MSYVPTFTIQRLPSSAFIAFKKECLGMRDVRNYVRHVNTEGQDTGYVGTELQCIGDVEAI